MTVITADWLIASADQSPQALSGVRVLGSEIVDAGRNEDLRKNYPEDEVVDANGKVILPGFVNAHTHLYLSLIHI